MKLIRVHYFSIKKLVICILLTCSGNIFCQSDSCTFAPELCYTYSTLPKYELGIEKKWESEAIVLSNQTPLFADIDNDCVPEIFAVFSGILFIVDPISGNTIRQIDIHIPGSNTSFVLVDINNDGFLEIIIAAQDSPSNPQDVDGKLVCYDYLGNILWVSDERYDNPSVGSLNGVPAVSDFNHDGIPEVYIFNKIFNAVNGALLLDGGNNGIGMGNPTSSSTIAAQIISNSENLELVAGYSVYEIEINNLNSQVNNNIIARNIEVNNELIDGLTTIADINDDGNLDVLVTSSGVDTESILYAYSYLTNSLVLLAQTYLEGAEADIGLPLAVNVTDEENISIYVTRHLLLHKLIYNGTTSFQKVWSFNTSDRFGSTALTAFDLNNDGRKEIILRDETTLYFLNDLNGEVSIVLEFPCIAPTGRENPIVGDFSNTGQASICVTCRNENNNSRLNVFGAPDSTSWAPARSIWNQYNYHVLNINDDGTVPQFMKNNATYQNGRYNNFMTQASLLDSLGNYQQKAMNVFGMIQCVNYDAENDEYTVTFDLENRDDASLTAPTNMEVSFYSDNPESTNSYLGTYHTLLTIPAGEALLDLEYTFSASNLSSLYMVINTIAPGGGALEDSLFTILECDYSDNLIVTFALPEIVELEANICEGDMYDFYGTILSGSGLYFENVKGNDACDSVVVSLLLTEDCESNCGEIDTSLCYVDKNFEQEEFTIEHKFKFQDSVSISEMLLVDINNDCVPEIITLGFNPEFDLNNNSNSSILIFDVQTGKIIQEIITPYIFAHEINQLAVGDVDSDGIPEIIAATSNNAQQENDRTKLFCFNVDGTVKWKSNKHFGIPFFSNDPPWSGSGGSPQLADFNHDGIPEVYINNKIFNAANGKMLIDGEDGGSGIGNYQNGRFSLPIAVQLDTTSTNLELVAGYTVYEITISNLNGQSGNLMVPHTIERNGEFRDGYTSIADLNDDGEIEVIVSSSGSVKTAEIYVYNYREKNLVFKSSTDIKFPTNAYHFWTPPIISDFENSNQLAILSAVDDSLYFFKYDGTEILKATYQEYTDHPEGYTVHDFNNDGIMEVLSFEMDSIVISNLINNQLQRVDAIFCKRVRPTALVGNINHVSETNLCVICEGEKVTQGDGSSFYNYYLHLFGGGKDNTWSPSRSIWNQRNYHILNINDDGTVPQFMKNNATYQNGRYNNFMTQASLLDSLGNYQQKAMNVFGAIHCVDYDAENDEYTVTFDIENRDDASLTAPVNMEVSFYSDNPEITNSYLGTYHTLLTIPAGEALLDLEFIFPASNLSSLYMVINTITPGGGPLEDSLFTLLECDYSDNLVVSFSLPEIVELDANICEGDTYDFYGTVLSDSGVYFENVKGSNGCDSVVAQLDLNITDTIMVNQSMETCDDYLWNDSTYTESGLYSYSTTSSLGCDSIVSLELIINYSIDMVDIQTVCDSFLWNDIVYTESDVYTYESITSNGCDSITTLDLTILRSTAEEIIHATCESYLWNGNTYTESGTYTYETNNENGCDSTATLLLTINDTIAVSQSNSVCDSYTWNGNTYTESGSYPYETISTLGCDSTITLELEVLSSTSFEDMVTSCDSLNWNGTTYFDSGTYDFSTINAVECDSTATLDLTINNTSEEFIEEMRCDSYSWNGTVYTESGIYSYPSTNQLGCDSVTILDLEINLSDNSTTTIEACDAYVWNDDVYSESGVYDFITVTTKGCDSIATLELTIYTKSETTVELSDCESITYNGEIIEEDGVYTYDFQSVHGCDSTIILVASILADKEQLEMTSCDTYTWDANGITYDESGSYSSIFQNIHGCDSILELDLTIQQSQLIEEIIDVCGSFYWPIIEDTIRESGFYSETFLTQEGCDSIFELDIVVHPNYIHADTIRATNEYTWEANNTTYTESGVYQVVYPSENLCDSIHILNLTINNSTEIVFPNVISFNGINNGLTAYGQTIELIESISVYDKWGSLLVRKENLLPNDPSLGWDGTYKGQEVAQGVYVFSCTILLKDGTKIMEYGDITVLR